MGALKGLSVFVLALWLVACANVATDKVETTQGQAIKVASSAGEDKVNIEQQIERISEKLKDKPTVKGWVLVGDANMHLKKYNEAVFAYREAYMLSDYADGPRKKLRRAMYFSGLEPENQQVDDK